MLFIHSDFIIKMSIMPHLVLIIYFTFSIGSEFLPTLEATLLCPRDQYWDLKKSACKECDAGFYEINCSEPCRYPNYGHECQNQCNCSLKACNHKIGCPVEILNMIESSPGDEKSKETSGNNTIVIVATLTTGFLLVIVSIIVVTTLLKRHFSRRILTTERNIDSFVVECIMREDRASSRESAANYVPRVCYETLYSDM